MFLSQNTALKLTNLKANNSILRRILVKTQKKLESYFSWPLGL